MTAQELVHIVIRMRNSASTTRSLIKRIGRPGYECDEAHSMGMLYGLARSSFHDAAFLVDYVAAHDQSGEKPVPS